MIVAPHPSGAAWRQCGAQQSPGSPSLQESPALHCSQRSDSDMTASTRSRCSPSFWVRDSLPAAKDSPLGPGAAASPSAHPRLAPSSPRDPAGTAHRPQRPPALLLRRQIPRWRGRPRCVPIPLPSSHTYTPLPRPVAPYLGAGSAPALSARRPAEPAGAGGRRALQKPSPRARCTAGNPALSSAGSSGFPRPAGEGRGAPGSAPPRFGGGGCAGGSALRPGPRRGRGACSRCG